MSFRLLRSPELAVHETQLSSLERVPPWSCSVLLLHIGMDRNVTRGTSVYVHYCLSTAHCDLHGMRLQRVAEILPGQHFIMSTADVPKHCSSESKLMRLRAMKISFAVIFPLRQSDEGCLVLDHHHHHYFISFIET